MKKILITSSNGTLAQKLDSLLTATADFNIIATPNGAHRLPETRAYASHSLDITHREQEQVIIGELMPDYIIHSAAMTNVDQCESDKEACWQLNVIAVEYLDEDSKKNDSYLVHLSAVVI